jgi:hypothetical protein
MTRGLRFSIADVMMLVLVVAVDCALVEFHFMNYLLLPEVSLLVFGLAKIGRGRASRLFWRGFEVAGWVALGLSLIVYQCYLRFDSFDFLVFPATWLERSGLFSRYGPAFGYACALTIYAGPQLAIATVAGCLTARYRVVRRFPHAVEAPAR